MPVFELYLNDLIETFADPRKRVFWGYLLCALLIALMYMVIARKTSVATAASTVFSKRVWWSKSSRLDYQVTLINKAVMQVLSPMLLTQLALATFLFYWFHEQFPARPVWLEDWSALSVGLVFTVSYFVLDDFARFYVHRLLHRWPSLWAFHKVHHSAQRMTPFTVFRTHPVEAVIFSLRSVLTQGVSIGTLVFFLGERADLVTVFGANILVFAFNVVGANLRHSHVPIRYWKWLEVIFISPAQHQIHHSIEERHWDKNFGVALAIWDRLFGSFHHSEAIPPKAFGLKEHREHTLRAVYLSPFAELFELTKKNLSRVVLRLITFVRSLHGKSNYGRSNESV